MAKADNSSQILKQKYSLETVLENYRLGWQSRFASILGRKEVLSGKAKFGIFGDGKELAQIALALYAKPGDWRSGYYRDQTLMLATGTITLTQFFAQLYADTDIDREPCSGGRQMNAHFATRYMDANGHWLNQMSEFQSSADISPTGGQMARALGLAFASKVYRGDLGKRMNPGSVDKFSHSGSEICFATIGNASTSEGVFWETLNASCVLQVPMVISVWDDGYGISVPGIYQTAKDSISRAVEGFARNGSDLDGLTDLDLYVADGRSFESLCAAYQAATDAARVSHRPSLVHVTHLTQPQGHSTSGSHERYKNQQRLDFEAKADCLQHFEKWILEQGFADKARLADIRESAEEEVLKAQQKAADDLEQSRSAQKLDISQRLGGEIGKKFISSSKSGPGYAQMAEWIREQIWDERLSAKAENRPFKPWVKPAKQAIYSLELCYTNHLMAGVDLSQMVAPVITSEALVVDGREVICRYFDLVLSRDPRVFVMGEDVGKLGGVNLEFDGLQEKYGEEQIFDTGIREATILGQGLGAAMRGLRPIVDIQYLDYLIYALQGMSDDLATLRYRTAGGQVAPVIVRTKGHRLEGIWHTGSPMGMILAACQGIHICVPRNAVQAAGMYEYLLGQNDPALVVEVLNGYRVKESLPENLGEYRVVPGVCEVLRSGQHITVLTYGACVRIALDAAEKLTRFGVETEVIDVQSLLPFDLKQVSLASVMKTAALLVLDEDVPGGASSHILDQVLVKQSAYQYLDCKPMVLSAKPNRSAYGNDGDYFCKPSVADVVEVIIDGLDVC